MFGTNASSISTCRTLPSSWRNPSSIARPCESIFASTRLAALNFMGLSFRLGGWGRTRHCIGMDRPANPQKVQRAEESGGDVLHLASLFFLPKTVFANACEKRFLFRNPSER